MRTAIATTEFLQSSAVWIYRQMSNDYIKHSLVFTDQVVNEGIYNHENVVVLKHKTGFLHTVKVLKRKYPLFDSIRFSRTNRQTVKKGLIDNKIELLHIHFGTYAVFFMDICTELEIPFVVTFHGFDITSAVNRWPLYKKKLGDLFLSMDMGLVISEEMKTRLLQLGCSENKLRVSYLGVPTDQFIPVDRSDRSKVQFLHAGRLTEKKGVEPLIHCFTNAFKGQEDVVLIVAGGGELRDSLTTLVKNLDMNSQIKVIGNLSQEELTKAYRDSDVFVLNSRTDSNGTQEGLPIGILEASSSALPIISTYHAGIPESVINEKTGILVTEYDDKALTCALVTMLDSQKRLEFGLNGRAYMEKKFALKNCNEQLSGIYRGIIS
ncbi:MAG: hypothetical protein COA58_01515 [Bacteroidetes bacterium]|nr:MAG: hypothetical protein COA58_01515 [Bacteroidota bacterium]